MAVRLRQWRIEDAPDLARLADNPKIAENMRDGFPQPYTLSDAENFIGMCLGFDVAEKDYRAIEMDGQLVGSISFTRGENVYRRSGEIGYMLWEGHWGKGIMTKAVILMCEDIFANTDLVRIYASVFSGNPSSGRVLEKAGFTLEGIQRKSVYKNGKIMDGLLYAKVRDENSI